MNLKADKAMVRIKKISFRELSMLVLMVANCSLWLFESVLNMHILVVLMDMLALFLLLLSRKILLQKNSTILLLYVLGILISVAVNGTTTRVLYRIVLIVLTVLYSVFFDYHPKAIEIGKKCLVFFGLLMAVTVLLQFVLKDAFSNPFYGILTEEDRREVLFYYKRGYYPGLNVKPHETAGLLAIAMGAMMIDRWDTGKRYLPMVLLVPMLLSGKRAITVLSVVAIVMLYFLELFANRKGVRILKMVLAVAVIGTLGLVIIMTNLDNPLFARFASLFNQKSGSFLDSARVNLWEDAVTVWKENPILGIGWWNFNDLTVTRFKYARSHSVNLDYLQWLAETGIVGFCLMFTPILVMMLRSVKMCFIAAKGKLAPMYRKHVYFAVYLQMFILAYALIEVPFYNNFFFTVYVFSVIVINTYYARYKRNPQEMKTGYQPDSGRNRIRVNPDEGN